ncbi:uncharacterized protein BKA55DRAFT_654355 [Fusarium redolens]|uniref:Uncharacterized protein n=1 Tax=Fusarium redolens TaxID=48865 RepID=A0A9P9G2Z5_FUSRE|nr:uncharacterized protein BKA55DRAFT_654355 [Fusarium redolens]KAH7230454.1 hypothetical protein BKA55DRAFT_654355 [Fusarium redolens]
MAPTLTGLPSEIRQQIFKECLKVDGGYIYDIQTDKLTNADEGHTLIDLSLRHTCRSIAKDTKTIPLAVNIIHFSTSFLRDDWRSLAGCFNLAATAYYILEQDLVFHLAEFITPAMFAQLDSKFPRFRSAFESELSNHNISNPVRDRPRSKSLVDRMRPPLCPWVDFFFRLYVDGPDVLGPFAHHSFAGAHEEDFMDPCRDLPSQPHKQWLEQSGDIRDALSYCLRLIAEQVPTEFANQVYKTLPHWVGKYQSQEFLRLKFNLWDIPSREEVAHLLALLNIHEFVWKLPEIWTYPLGFYQELGDAPSKPRPENAERGQYATEYDNPMRLVQHFDYRYRKKIRFSATASAIRFLQRLPVDQRIQIRRVTLHEDSPSVNMPSLHAQGLVPLFKENPLLRVERRVSVFGCIYNFAGPSEDCITRAKTRPLYGPSFLPKLQSWLIDALAMRDLDIPTGSFTFTLEGGPYGDFCTEVFQGCILMSIADDEAFIKCGELGLFRSIDSMSCTPDHFFLDPRFKEAIDHLVNQTSILRSDFNPGVPVDPNAVVEESKGFDDVEDLIERWEYSAIFFGCKMPTDLYYDVMLAAKYDFQTREQYIESQGGKVKEQES